MIEQSKCGPKKKEITDEMLPKIEELAGLGFTQENIYNYFGMSCDTWYKRVKEKPEIAEAIKRGKAKTLANVTGKLMELVNQKNLGAIIFYLKTQHRWSENLNITTELKEKAPVSLDTKDPAEASKIYQKIMSES